MADRGVTWLTCGKCGGLVEGRDPVCPACGERAAEVRNRPRRLLGLPRGRLFLVLTVLTVLAVGAGFALKAFRTTEADQLNDLRQRVATLMDRGDTAAAAILTRQILEKLPDDPSALLALGQCEEAEGRPERARDLYDRVVRAEPRNARAHALLARRLLQAGDAAAAYPLAARAVDLDPEFGLARYLAGTTAMDLGLVAAARRHLLAARQSDPDNLEISVRLAELMGDEVQKDPRWIQSRMKKAEEAARADPSLAPLHAQLLILAGYPDRALAVCLSRLRDAPADPRALELALRLLPREDSGRADSLVAAAEDAGLGPNAVLLLARRRIAEGDFEAADAVLAGRSGSEADLLRVSRLRRSGQVEAALDVLDGLDPGVAGAPAFRHQRALLLAEAGRVPEALDALEALARADPDRIDFLLGATDAIVTGIESGPGGQEDSAARILPLLASLPPGEPAVAGLLARALLIVGRVDEADAALGSIDSAFASDPIFRRARVRLLLMRGEIKAAIEEAMRTRDAPSPRFLRSVARFALRAGRFEDVERLAALSVDRDVDVSWRSLRARADLARSRPEDALRRLEGLDAPADRLLAAAALHRTGRVDEATALAREVAARPEFAGDALSLLAFWAVLEGDADRVVAILDSPDVGDSAARAAHLRLSERLRVAGRGPGIRWLRDAAARWPDDPEVLGAWSLAELRRGLGSTEVRERRTGIERAIEAHRSVGTLRLAGGYLRLIDGDAVAARRVATAALSADPLDADARILLVRAAARAGDFPAARDQIRSLVRLHPGDPLARSLKPLIDAMEARSLLRDNDPDAAAAVLSEGLRSGRRTPPALLASARVEIVRGDLEAAARALREVGLDDDAEFLELGARLESALAAGRPSDALGACRRMAEIRPNSPLVHLRRGLLALRAGEAEEGIAALETAHLIEPGWDVAFVSLVDGLRRVGNFDRARARIRARLEASPGDPYALGLEAEEKVRAGDLPGARAFAERSLERGGGDLARQVLLRAVIASEGSAAAFELARAWADVEAPAPEVLALVGRVALIAGDEAEAERAFEAALAADPGQVPALAGLAEIATGRLEHQRAIRYLETAVEVAPGEPSLRFYLASLLHVRGDAGAAEAYRAVLALDPRHPLALSNLSLLRSEEEGGIEEALELSRRAIEALPGAPEIVDARAWVLFRAGDAAGAVPLLREAVRAGGGAIVRAHLAIALDESGGKEEARALCDELLALPRPPLAEELRRRRDRMK